MILFISKLWSFLFTKHFVNIVHYHFLIFQYARHLKLVSIKSHLAASHVASKTFFSSYKVGFSVGYKIKQELWEPLASNVWGFFSLVLTFSRGHSGINGSTTWSECGSNQNISLTFPTYCGSEPMYSSRTKNWFHTHPLLIRCILDLPCLLNLVLPGATSPNGAVTRVTPLAGITPALVPLRSWACKGIWEL